MGQRIAPEDLTWLLMDRPHNLMHVNGLFGFDTLPGIDDFTRIATERIVHKYRVLSQVALEHEGAWMWQDDPFFSIDRHVRRVVLDDIDDATVREYVSRQFSVPFDRSRPLWEFQLIAGPDGDEAGGYMYARFHHGLGDGIRLVQLILGLCDASDGAAPGAVGRRSGRHGPLDRVRRVVGHSVSDTVDLVGNAGQTLATAGRSLVSTMNPVRLTNQVTEAAAFIRQPVKMIETLTATTSLDNELSNSWRELGRMLLSDGHQAGAWSGHAGVDKSVAWVERFPLAGLRATSKAFGVSLNDVMLAAVSLALTDYLTGRGATDVEELSWMMPVSLQPIDATLPPKLGNHFVVVMLAMPLGRRDPEDLLTEIHERTTRLKNSVEPMVAFGFQRAIAESPSAVARRVTDFFAGKTIGQLSNVPGPRVALTMAGMPIRSMLGWVPTSGDQPIGVCLFSYDGTVNVGVATDQRMIPDPMNFVELVESHLAELAALAPEYAPSA